MKLVYEPIMLISFRWKQGPQIGVGNLERYRVHDKGKHVGEFDVLERSKMNWYDWRFRAVETESVV